VSEALAPLVIWLSSVFSGAALGFIVGGSFMKWWLRRRARDSGFVPYDAQLFDAHDRPRKRRWPWV